MASEGPAMGKSLGRSSSVQEDSLLKSLMLAVPNRFILMIGDSSLRNQFVQLARIGLSFARDLPVAYSVGHKKHAGLFLAPFKIMPEDKPDSSNGFWGQFPWLLASTQSNLTLMYVKVWGCSSTASVLHKINAVLPKQREQNPALAAAWPPDIVLWNFGLHLLHVYPARPVPTTSLQCALEYERLVNESFSALRKLLPSARLIWRTTNSVCDSSFVGTWATAAYAYHCSDQTCMTPRVVRTRKLCQRRYNITQRQCQETFMDRRNTAAQRERSLSVLHPSLATGRLQVLDAFDITDGHCTSTADGRHYPQLLARLNTRFLQLLV